VVVDRKLWQFLKRRQLRRLPPQLTLLVTKDFSVSGSAVEGCEEIGALLGGNVKQHNCCGKQCGDSSKNSKERYHMIR